MTFRRPSFLLNACIAVSGLMSAVASAIAPSAHAVPVKATRGARPRVRKPYVKVSKSYIRGGGPQWAGRPVVTNKMRCDARNHPKGKVYTGDDLWWMRRAEQKRRRKHWQGVGTIGGYRQSYEGLRKAIEAL